MWNRYSHQNFIWFFLAQFLILSPHTFVQTATQFSRYRSKCSKVFRLFCWHFFLSKGSIMFLTNWMYCKDNSVWELIPQWKEARFRDLPLTANEENKAWKFKTKTDDWYWNCNWLKAKFLNLIWGDHYGKDRAEGWNILWKVTVAHGCPGVFSNWLLHAGVQKYFLIDCRTRVFRSIF